MKHIGLAVSCTARTLSKCFDTIPTDGVSSQQMRIAGFIAHNGACTQKSIENVFNLSRAGVSQLVDHMEANGLVVRMPSEEDKRLCLVTLTEEGMSRAQKQYNEICKLEEYLYSSLTKEEAAAFLSILSKLNDSMEAYLDKAACKKCR